MIPKTAYTVAGLSYGESIRSLLVGLFVAVVVVVGLSVSVGLVACVEGDSVGRVACVVGDSVDSVVGCVAGESVVTGVSVEGVSPVVGGVSCVVGVVC